MNLLRLTLFLSFAASGFAGLIYESIWSRYLKLILGHSAYAQSLVIALFMGGLSLGSWLASRYSVRWRNLLRWYAAAEAVIGVLGLLFQPLFEGVSGLAFGTLMPALGSPGAVGALKLLLSALLILPPSVLLGMTFPLMSAGIVRLHPRLAGSSIATLYFANSIGAAGGVLASGFLLVGRFGLPGTILAAAVLNLLVAAVVYVAARAAPGPGFASGSPAEGAGRNGGPAVRYDLMLLVAALTGLASFIYEIGWIRMLSLVLGSSTHSFELMLSAFIAGLAFGGLWIRHRIDSISDPVHFLAAVQLAMGLLALGTVPVYANCFELMGWIMKSLPRTEQGYTLFNLAGHGVALLVMFPATFCAGMTLPLITQALLKGGSGEKSIGAVYAANTLGAIAGVLLATHLGMPLLGLKGLVSAGAAVDLGLGVALLHLSAGAARRLPAAAAVVGLLALAAVLAGVRLDPLKMASGVYRYGDLISEEKAQNTFHKDGRTSSVDLVRYASGGLVLFTNGKGEAAINLGGVEPERDEITMVLSAVLPLAAHPGARTAAVIGMGSGQTSHVLLGSESLERVDTIEIEAAVIEAARRFGPHVERVFSDPRSAIFIDDARSFLSTHNARYDIIVAEPSNPWVSGVSSLFSAEFYELADRHLAPGGMLAQWLQLYEIDTRLVASVMGALARTFPGYAIYATDDANMLILAHRGSGSETLDEQLFGHPGIAAELRRHRIHSVADLEVRRIGGRGVLQPLFDSYGSPPNSDFHPFLDLNAVRSRFLDHSANALLAIRTAPVPVLDMLSSPGGGRGYRSSSPEGTFAAGTGLAMLQVVRNARAIRDYFEQPNAETLQLLPPELRRAARLSRGFLEGCSRPADAQQWLQSLIGIAAAVNPALDDGQRRRFWNLVASSECCRSLPQAGRSWVSLFAAVGSRDARRMADIGAEVLRRSGGAPASWRSYAVAAAMAGHLALREKGKAAQLWARFHGDLGDRPEAEALLLRLLRAHSEG